MTAVEVRLVRADEHVPAGRLVVSAYVALAGAHMSGGYEHELADVARRADEAEVLVAMEDARLLGCVTFVPDRSNRWAEEVEDGEASIRMLAVDPAVQRRGTGRALLDACIVRARAGGQQAVFLHSTPWMTVAQRLYLQAGFVRVPAATGFPVAAVPLIAFRLAL